MSATEINTLANTLDYTRGITLQYFDKLKEVDPHHLFEVDGKKLNSTLWIMAHLAVTENFLILRSTGGEMIRFSWAKLFGLGSTIPEPKDCPPFEEVLSTMKTVHQNSIAHLRTLNDADLIKATTTGFKFGGEDSFRRVITHSISHEGTHAGHLGWLCKLHGIKTL